MKKPQILLLDVETAPAEGYVWGKWEQNVIEFKQHGYMLSFAWQWLGNKKVSCLALPDFAASYKNSVQDDGALLRRLWELLDKADIVIAQNGDRFDLRTSNARFIRFDLDPPSPYKTIDTLKIARKHFRFPSNSLDDLAQYLGIGRKLPHHGKHTWLGCMDGDPKAWRTMKRYNAHDVYLLEQVYLRLRAWATTHPNLDNFAKKGNCSRCGSDSVQKRGWEMTKTGKRARIHCQTCGAWTYGVKHIREAA